LDPVTIAIWLVSFDPILSILLHTNADASFHNNSLAEIDIISNSFPSFI
jgi:hypothetical protein